MPDQPLYDALIVKIFKNHYRKGVDQFEFDREELEKVAAQLSLRLPKNLGDLIYSFRYRKTLPAEIVDTATGKKEWSIEPAGRAKYPLPLGSRQPDHSARRLDRDQDSRFHP